MTAPNSALETARVGLDLDSLVQGLASFSAILIGNGNIRVCDVQQDSRKIKPGDLFVARAGQHADGRAFIEAAIKGGAAAVMVGHEASTMTQMSVPIVSVSDARRASAFAAEAVQGFPSHQLRVVGITGTNGKTTTVALVERGLAAAGARPARLGTTGFCFGDIADEGNLTTPEADEISRLIGGVARGGGTHFLSWKSQATHWTRGALMRCALRQRHLPI